MIAFPHCRDCPSRHACASVRSCAKAIETEKHVRKPRTFAHPTRRAVFMDCEHRVIGYLTMRDGIDHVMYGGFLYQRVTTGAHPEVYRRTIYEEVSMMESAP